VTLLSRLSAKNNRRLSSLSVGKRTTDATIPTLLNIPDIDTLVFADCQVTDNGISQLKEEEKPE